MMEEELIKCPFCDSTEYICERESPILALVNPFHGDYRHYKFFCTNCKKDF